MAIDVKKARSAIDRAQAASGHIKWFFKFAEAMHDLDGELGKLGSLDADVAASEKRKTDAEAVIPGLEKRLSELNSSKAKLDAEHQARRCNAKRPVG